jgi:hypothetical protein
MSKEKQENRIYTNTQTHSLMKASWTLAESIAITCIHHEPNKTDPFPSKDQTKYESKATKHQLPHTNGLQKAMLRTELSP